MIKALVFFAFFSFGNEVSFFEHNPRPQVLYKTQFPRHGQLLYRGTVERQYSLGQAVRAMLGDPQMEVESLLMSLLRSELQGEVFPYKSKVEAVYYKRNYGQIVRRILEQGPLSPQQARQIAKEILHQYLLTYTPQDLADVYFNYESPSYNNFNRDIVTTTPFLEVAAYYGPRIVVINEQVPRSVDVNYWNYVRNRKWVDTKPRWKDLGEFVHPIFIPATDVVGYQIRTHYAHEAWRHRLKEDLDWAFYLEKDGDRPFVIVIDGKQSSGTPSQGVMWDSKQNTYVYLSSNFSRWDGIWSPFVEMPSPLEPARIAGIFQLCQKTEICEVPTSISSKIKARSSRPFPDQHMAEILGSGFGDHELVFH